MSDLKSLNQEDLLEGKRYNHSQRLRVKAALADISTTRKTGKIAEKKKLRILLELAKYPPDIVELACDWYVAHNCAAEGKNERYLIAICRNQAKRREIEKQKRAARLKVDANGQWYDGTRMWSREDMEHQREDLVRAWDEHRNTDPAKVTRVNRCMHERPQWDWA